MDEEDTRRISRGATCCAQTCSRCGRCDSMNILSMFTFVFSPCLVPRAYTCLCRAHLCSGCLKRRVSIWIRPPGSVPFCEPGLALMKTDTFSSDHGHAFAQLQPGTPGIAGSFNRNQYTSDRSLPRNSFDTHARNFLHKKSYV